MMWGEEKEYGWSDALVSPSSEVSLGETEILFVKQEVNEEV